MSNPNIDINVSGPKQASSTYKTKVLKGNHSFASQVTEPNMKYVIKHDFVLDGDVTIPESCILEFDGGSIKGGSIEFDDTIIINNDMKEIFDLTSVSGNILNKEVYLSWWKLAYDEEVNDGVLINEIISLCDNCTFYYDIQDDVYVGGVISEVSPNPDVAEIGQNIYVHNKNYIYFRQTTPYYTILKGPSRYGDVFDLRSCKHAVVSGVKVDGNNIRHHYIGENGFGVVDCLFTDIHDCIAKNCQKGYDKAAVDGDIYDHNHYPEWGNGGKGFQIEAGVTHAFCHDCEVYDCYVGISNNQTNVCTVLYDSIHIERCNIGIIALRLHSTFATTTFNNIMLFDCTGENGLICMGNVHGVTISNINVKGSTVADSLLRGCYSLCNIDILCSQQCRTLIDSALFRDNPEGDTSTLNNVHIAAGDLTNIFGITPLEYPKYTRDPQDSEQWIEGAKYAKYNSGKFSISCTAGSESQVTDLTKLMYNSPKIEIITQSYSNGGGFGDIISTRNRLPNDIVKRGTTAQRPANPPLGFSYFDITINKTIYYASTILGNIKWVDEKGYTPALSKGTTSQMQGLISGSTPTLDVNDEGYEFFNTSYGYPCYLKKVDSSTVKWVKADGTDAPTT